jgi:hypothetical protein
VARARRPTADVPAWRRLTEAAATASVAAAASGVAAVVAAADVGAKGGEHA